VEIGTVYASFLGDDIEMKRSDSFAPPPLALYELSLKEF